MLKLNVGHHKIQWNERMIQVVGFNEAKKESDIK